MTPRLRAAFHLFAENERWGTCGECPEDGIGQKQPRLCAHTKRPDHNLTLPDLADALYMERQRTARRDA